MDLQCYFLCFIWSRDAVTITAMDKTKMAVNNSSQRSDHFNRKSLKCKTCGKACAGRGILKIHERVHTGEKPFKCSCCNKRFSQAGNLQRHERTHTGEKPFVCGQCGRCFSDSRSLKKHKEVHTKEDDLLNSNQ